MKNRIESFFESIKEKPIEFYSEFGLQHELALYLRTTYKDLTVKLEYPTNRILRPLPELLKKEIDIFIETDCGKKYVIELKMPKDNGGIPKAMYHALEDAKFLEQLKENNIDGCFSILATSSTAFWEAPRAEAGIYNYFNGLQVNFKTIDIPQLPYFLHKKGLISLNKEYKTEWLDYEDVESKKWKYYVLEV